MIIKSCSKNLIVFHKINTSIVKVYLFVTLSCVMIKRLTMLFSFRRSKDVFIQMLILGIYSTRINEINKCLENIDHYRQWKKIVSNRVEIRG